MPDLPLISLTCPTHQGTSQIIQFDANTSSTYNVGFLQRYNTPAGLGTVIGEADNKLWFWLDKDRCISFWEPIKTNLFNYAGFSATDDLNYPPQLDQHIKNTFNRSILYLARQNQCTESELKLWNQVQQKNYTDLRTSIKSGRCLNNMTINFKLILWEALEDTTNGLLNELITNNPNDKDEFLKECFLNACFKGQINFLNLLFDYDINVNATDESGATGLILAARAGHLNAVSMLIKKGANIDLKDHNEGNAILYATKNNNLDIVKILIAHNANVTTPDKQNYTPFIYAVMNGNFSLIKCLLENGAKINDLDTAKNNALIIATLLNRLDIINLLLEYKIEINTQNKVGNTALILAAKKGYTEIGETLIKHGADIEVFNIEKDNAFILAATNGQMKMLKILFDKKANMEVQNKYGDTALLSAVADGQKQAVEFLLKLGANPLIVNHDNKNAFDLARESKHAEIINVLIQFENTYQNRLNRINYEGDIPEYAVCTLSQGTNIVNDPITVSSGYTYNRIALRKLFALNRDPDQIPCPNNQSIMIDRKELHNGTDVILNRLIDMFVTQQEKLYEQYCNNTVNQSQHFAKFFTPDITNEDGTTPSPRSATK